MNEDATFEKLKRIPYEEMLGQLVDVVRQWNFANRISNGQSFRERGESVILTVNAHLRGTGWNFDDFFVVVEDGSVNWNPRSTKFI